MSLVQIKGETYHIPALLELLLVLIPGGELHDLNLWNVLLEKSQAE